MVIIIEDDYDLIYSGSVLTPNGGSFAVEIVQNYLYLVTTKSDSEKLFFYVYDVDDINLDSGLWKAFKTITYSSDNVLKNTK